MERYHDPVELADLLGNWESCQGSLHGRLSWALRLAVRNGDLQAGMRLPSERELSKALGVSRGTVVAAYNDLRDRGLVQSRRGSGTKVGHAALRLATRKLGTDRVDLTKPDDLISLKTSGCSAFPEVAEALRELATNRFPDLLAHDTGDPAGSPALRAAIADRLGRAVPTTPAQVLVTTGKRHALALVTRLFLPRGATVVVESPNRPSWLKVLRAAGANVVPVPLDEHGIEVDAVSRAFIHEAPSLLLTMPACHYPTGTAMSAGRRRLVAEIALRHRVPVVEYHDETELPEACKPLAAYASPGAEVLTIGSLENLWEGLRVGWIRAPAAVIERLTLCRNEADPADSVIDQALAAQMLPRLDAIAATDETARRRRLAHLCRLLTEHLPDWRWRIPDGGSGLWTELPGVSGHVFARTALAHGVEVLPGADTDPTGEHDNFLRLPFTFERRILTEMVHRLARAWSALCSEAVTRRDPAGG